MDTTPAAKRGRALKEAFFGEQYEELRRKLREKMATPAKKKVLAALSGITDDSVLEELLTLGISGDTLAAVSLVPLIEVAWEDGSVDDDEREAVLAAAEKAGLAEDSASYRLLERWLVTRPDRHLFDAWRRYLRALLENMTPDAGKALSRDLMDRTRSVAEAAGGFFRFRNKISESERRALAELEEFFRSISRDE